MDSLKFNENSCLICLNHNATLNWNDDIFEFSGISYKDCYYKYTKLKETDMLSDSHCYPTKLCEICGNELKNAHILFEKALESFNILQGVLPTEQFQTKYSHMEICNTLKCEIEAFAETDIPMEDDTLIGTDGRERIPKIECGLNSSKEMPKYEDMTIEPRHFIDIKVLESASEEPLEHQLSDFVDIKGKKPLTTNKTRNKRKKHESLASPVLDQQMSEACNDSDPPISKSNKKFRLRRKKYESLSETLLEQQVNSTTSEQNFIEKCDTKSVQSTTTKPAKKPKEKYLLMCSYCSLKVHGASKLAKHEDTHSENRKRTEECPKCGVKLYTKVTLVNHMKIHDDNRQKNNKCEFCEKAFFNKGALNVHRRIHLGLMVKCHICQKEFFRKNDLDKHLLRHSEAPLKTNVGQTKYTVQCQYCNKSVVTFKYKEHVAVHLDQPQMKCKICERNFFSRNNCCKHLRRFHHKNASEYEDFIHYYDQKTRVNSLVMKQQLSAQPVIENQVP